MNEASTIIELFLNDQRIGGSKESPTLMQMFLNKCFNLKVNQLIFYKPVEDFFTLRYKKMMFLDCHVSNFGKLYSTNYKTYMEDVLIKSSNYILL
jgi:hypothetical protein